VKDKNGGNRKVNWYWYVVMKGRIRIYC
jgi:hypothetical protein